jgi:hypothetical protein
MATWTVTITDPTRSKITSGIAPDEPSARSAGAAAARAHARRTARDRLPLCRYTIVVNGEIAAIVATGVDESGQPAHAEAADLVADLYWAPVPDLADATYPASKTRWNTAMAHEEAIR